MERDPRRDPKRGDKLRIAGIGMRLVIETTPGMVTFEVDGIAHPNHAQRLQDWRKWAANAVVEHTAE